MKICPICRTEFPPGANYCPHDGQSLRLVASASDMLRDPLIGQLIDDRYRIESVLGQGGMGIVYTARHVVIDKAVALKVLREEYCRREGLVERFIREARAASRIGHPNIVDVTDFGELSNGQTFLVMEHLEGTTLASELQRLDERMERMPISRVLDLSIQICQGLAAAHAKGIVHRDLKPENIFIVSPRNDTLLEDTGGYRLDFVKVLDFGIAKCQSKQRARMRTTAATSIRSGACSTKP